MIVSVSIATLPNVEIALRSVLQRGELRIEASGPGPILRFLDGLQHEELSAHLTKTEARTLAALLLRAVDEDEAVSHAELCAEQAR
jgi:hypothetical protein